MTRPRDAIAVARALEEIAMIASSTNQYHLRLGARMLRDYAASMSGVCPENMLPCDGGCTGGWCATLHGRKPSLDSGAKGESK